jgi:hypothetical protein
VARTRALLTERDRELLSGDGTESRQYQAISETRARINEELTTDLEILREHHPELLDELRDVVCEDE